MNKYIKHKFFQAKLGLEDVSKLVIGVYSCGTSIDITSLGLQISSYCSDWMNKRTCYIEYMKSESIESMNLYYKMKEDSRNKDRYTYQGIDYYSNITKDNLYPILSSGYQCIIIDFTWKEKGAIKDLCLCDKIILATSLKPWKLYELERCFEDIQHGDQREIMIGCEVLSKGYYKWIMDRYRHDFHRYNIKKLIQLPSLEYPFILSEESLDAMNQLFRIK